MAIRADKSSSALMSTIVVAGMLFYGIGVTAVITITLAKQPRSTYALVISANSSGATCAECGLVESTLVIGAEANEHRSISNAMLSAGWESNQVNSARVTVRF